MKASLLYLLAAMLATVSFAETGSYSDYLFLIDSCTGFFGDSTVMNGPVRSNDPLRIVSFTPGRDEDPYFYNFTSASDYYLTFKAETPEWILATEPHPDSTNLWIEPYELMCQGPPWFNLGADFIPFGADSIDWQTTYDAACDYGLVIDSPLSGSRIVLEADSLHLRECFDTGIESYCISDLAEPVVWLDNQPGDTVYIRSMPPDSGPGLTVPLTIGCNGYVFAMGDLQYQPYSGGMLGMVMKEGNLEIADKPEFDPWEGIWAIDTEKDMVFSGSFLIVQGKFQTENPWEPSPAADFHIFGGIQMRDEGITAYVSGSNSWGYFASYDFDPRFFTASPPFYPTYDTSTGIEPESPPSVESGLVVLGNPFESHLSVELSEPSREPGRLLLLDVSGRLVLQGSISDQCLFDTSELPPGSYLLIYESSAGTECRKVVKLN